MSEWEVVGKKKLDESGVWQPDIIAPNPVREGLEATGQTVDDAMRAAANAVSFGMADRLAGAASGTGTAAQVKLSKQARERSPYASIAGDAAGIVALPGIGGAGVAARLGSGPAARAVGYGAEGAVIGAGQGAGNTYEGSWSDTLRNAGMGALFGGAGGAAGGAAFAPRPPVSTARTPPVDEIGQAKTIAYDALRNQTVPYDAGRFRTMAGDLEQRLHQEGFVRDYSPGSWAAIDRMNLTAGQPGAFITPANIDTIRKGINRIPRSDIAATDRESGRLVKEALDDFMINPPPGAVPPGRQADAVRAGQVANTARGLAAGEFRAQKMADIIEGAENAAAAANSGLNRENTIRQHVKNFINPLTGGRQRLAGYTDEEQAALRGIVHRGGVANTGRIIGNMLGGGGGIGTLGATAITGTAGGALGQYFKEDPVTGAAIGTVLPLAGMGLRGASNRSAANTIRIADELIRQRNPLYQARAAVAPMAPGPSTLSAANTARARDLIALELLKQQEGE